LQIPKFMQNCDTVIWYHKY